jgi:hypothetical protein
MEQPSLNSEVKRASRVSLTAASCSSVERTVESSGKLLCEYSLYPASHARFACHLLAPDGQRLQSGCQCSSIGAWSLKVSFRERQVEAVHQVGIPHLNVVVVVLLLCPVVFILWFWQAHFLPGTESLRMATFNPDSSGLEVAHYSGLEFARGREDKIFVNGSHRDASSFAEYKPDTLPTYHAVVTAKRKKSKRVPLWGVIVIVFLVLAIAAAIAIPVAMKLAQKPTSE